MANPKDSWLNSTLNRRRIIQRLVFPKRLSVKNDKNFRKPEKALLFLLAEKLSGENPALVVPNGLTSNRLIHFVTALQELSKAFEAPPKLDGKVFQWESLVAAA